MRTRPFLHVALCMDIAIGIATTACSPSTPGTRGSGPLTTPMAGEPAASIADGGAPRVCMHDTTDLAPCAEDCDRGIVFACTVVAARTERGEGTARDLTRAVHLHERACELRDPASCVSAARMHAAGAGVPPSRTKQVDLLGAACTLGEALACAVPAKAFANGNGVARDERRAAELWERACAGGVAAACREIDGGD